MTDGLTVQLLMPELLLLALAAWTYVAGAFSNYRQGFNWVAVVGLLLAGWAVYAQGASVGGFAGPSLADTSGPLLVDGFGYSLRWAVLAIGLLFVMTAWRASSEELSTEYLGSLVLLLCGLLLVCSAGDLVLLFLGLELVSIPTYILLYLGRRDAASQEATAKYFFLSILTSAVLLYGFALLYGAAGSTRLVEIRSALAAGDAPLSRFAPIALVFIFAGLGFKLALVPLHFYAPDVYQGTTSGNAGLLSVAPKVAGLVALVRIVMGAMANEELARLAWQLALAIALITMTLGNVTALWQRNVRRMMAYSSIAHAGYLFIGVAVSLAVLAGAETSGAYEGLAATLLYLVVYSIATVGTFAALTYLARDDREVEDVDDLAGLGRSRPLIALSLAVFMFSLTGIPPLAGFWGKLALLVSALSFESVEGSSAVQYWFLALAVVAAINAAISAGYYLRIVGVMYFRSPRGTLSPQGGRGPWLATVSAAVLTVVVGLVPGILFRQADRAAFSLAASEAPMSEPRQLLAAQTTAEPRH